MVLPDSTDEAPLQPAEPPNADNQPRRMSARVRARLILLNRQRRKHRRNFITCHQQFAVRSAAFRSFALAPAAPAPNIGLGHECYTIGCIVFCRRCGATRSYSQGLRLTRPCRRWAPFGTRCHVSALMRGKPNHFYRQILANSATPVKRLRSKTSPQVRFEIPAHLRHHSPPPARGHPITITRRTAHSGTRFTVGDRSQASGLN